MKKILSILSTISLSTIISTNIIACNTPNKNNKPNTNNNETEKQFNPQQPRENSKWKLIDKNEFKNEFNTYNNKLYFMIWYQNNNYVNNLIKNDNYINNSLIKTIYKETNLIYRWDGVNEPTIPTINSNTGEINDWNEKIES